MENRTSEPGEANKKCPGCGAGFRCEGDADCWCEKVPIHRAQMIEIMELFTDCICPECMKKFEARE